MTRRGSPGATGSATGVAGDQARACFLRARRPAEKAQRRDSILAAAAQLFRDRDLDGITMTEIARRAGVSKGNLYRYFATKEELFLQLYLEDLGAWCESLRGRLAALDAAGAPPATADAIADVLVASVADRPRFPELTALLSTVLERNLTEQAIADFKAAAGERVLELVGALAGALPALGLDGAARAVTYVHALVAGLWPMTHPAPTLARVLERPNLAHLSVDWSTTLAGSVRALLRGLVAEADG